jgi:magnesium chelatase family protein
MELSTVNSRAIAGIDSPPVQVETHLSNGLPAFNIVGLPETTVREAKDRVRSALLNSHFAFPDRRITINLAPADLPKEGGRFDLPIALGILAASGQVPPDLLPQHEFIGELALNGQLRPVPGLVAAAMACRDAKRCLVVSSDAASRAALVPQSRVIGAPDILTLCAHLNGAAPLPTAQSQAVANSHIYPDLDQVIGQAGAKRALEIAASGGHNLLLSGPPGTGKTLLASRLPGILPSPNEEEVLTNIALRDLHETAGEYSLEMRRPFRNPHHSASAAALVGGGARPRPGEISLSHGGVLFLDELPEFSRSCLEMLRQPLESGEITLSRARHKFTFPARFQLVAAMNPCPCGYLGDPERRCRCTPEQVQRYRTRLSGPLLDRIDLHVQVGRVSAADLLNPRYEGECSAVVRQRVIAARERQLARQRCANAQLHSDALLEACSLGLQEQRHLASAANTLKLSGRALHRSLKVSRTIADLEGAERVERAHISEALGYRTESPHI